MAVATALFMALILLCPRVEAAGGILDYRAVFKPFYGADGAIKIAVREFERNGSGRALVVDAENFRTEEVDSSAIDSGRKVAEDLWRRTPFVSALYRYTVAGSDGPERNGGIRRAETPTDGVFLTVDMCPSKRGFDKDLFTSTISLPLGHRPVAIAISGLWIERHRSEFDWLAEQARAKRITVTWVNHSYSHPYKKGAPDRRNFLLTEGVDMDREAFGVEVLLLESGQLPSPFFRFPGLVSDRKALERLRALSLIPVGADAWLAKGQRPAPGSIILVHGNGNERRGIEMLLKFYAERKDDIRKGRLVLRPLRDAFAR